LDVIQKESGQAMGMEKFKASSSVIVIWLFIRQPHLSMHLSALTFQASAAGLLEDGFLSANRDGRRRKLQFLKCTSLLLNESGNGKRERKEVHRPALRFISLFSVQFYGNAFPTVSRARTAL
jgi:DNA-binding transcriptional ArsR family regulator